jgi:G3E family GTPase
LFLSAVSLSMAGTPAEDQAILANLKAQIDAAELTVEQALETAIRQQVSFAEIVSFCRSNAIPMSAVLVAARSAGLSPEVALTRLGEAGVPQDELQAALAQVNEQGDTGLGYTPDAGTQRPNRVLPVTANPGGTAQGRSVSPSTL